MDLIIKSLKKFEYKEKMEKKIKNKSKVFFDWLLC